MVDRRRIVERAEVEGSPVIVTEFIQGFTTFAAWVQARVPAGASPTTGPGAPPAKRPGEVTDLFGPSGAAGRGTDNPRAARVHPSVTDRRRARRSCTHARTCRSPRPLPTSSRNPAVARRAGQSPARRVTYASGTPPSAGRHDATLRSPGDTRPRPPLRRRRRRQRRLGHGRDDRALRRTSLGSAPDQGTRAAQRSKAAGKVSAP